MLERTAISIETCSLQKVLPATRPPFTSRRRLHTNFWSHGASSVELLDACRALVLLPSADCEALPAQQPKPTRRPDTMTASAFLLDFLYPGGAAALLQRLRPNFLQRFEPNQLSSGRVSARPFTSSASDPPGAASIPVEKPQAADTPRESSREEDSALGGDEFHAQNNGSIFDDLQGSDPLGPAGVTRGQSHLQVVRDLLESQGQSYEMLWEEYMHLKPSERNQFRTDITLRLASSDRPIDAKRASMLFSHLYPEEWTPELVNAAIKAKLVLHDTESALEIFEAALSRRSIGHGIDALLCYGLREGLLDFVARLLPVHSTAVDVCGAMKYQELPTLPSFGKRIGKLRSYLKKQRSAEEAGQLLQQLSRLLGCLARSSLASFQPGETNYVLFYSQDATAYYSHITFCIREKRFEQAGMLYRRYRELPGVHVPLDVLRSMLDVFLDDIPQIEMVMKDWTRFHGRLDVRAIKKIMPMYARRGDVESVTYLAREWATLSPRGIQIDPVPCVAHQMHAHAVRGEPEPARRLLEEATKKMGKSPGPILWNILINAYTKTYDYEGALRTLKELSTYETPDHVSFGTVMNFASFRGDLDSTIELYTLATNKGINPDLSMIDAVLEAYCQNDRLPQAEGLCTKMTRTRPVDGNYVILWNTLLRHLAERRDLNGVNRVLETMKDFGVRYNNETYSHLLTGLVNCRQSHHALHFLRTSVEHNVFRPTYDHYMLLMAAFVQSREPHVVLAINERLKKLDIPGSPRQVTAVVKALEVWSKMPARRRNGGDGREYIARALKEFWEFVKTDTPSTTKDFESTTSVYTRMMFILAQLRDFSSVQELIDLYQRQFPDNSSLEAIPVTLLHNLMLADFYEKKYESVKATWEIVLDRTTREGKPPEAGPSAGSDSPAERRKVLPTYRFWLSKPLQTMQRVYLNECDADGLLAVVARVQEAGFALDRLNWNYHVQALATLHRWREAFFAFEHHLMPHWTGWATARITDPAKKNLLPLETRRVGSDPHRLRPLAETLFLLFREFQIMEGRAVFSRDASRELADIVEQCPNVVRAIGGFIRSSSGRLQYEIIDGPPIDLGDGKTRRIVAEDYFEKVLLARLGIRKEDDAPLDADGQPLAGAAGREAPRGEDSSAGDDQQWEDVPESEVKTKKRRRGKSLRWLDVANRR
jgi:pentatricopeptide repeat-containing protein PET309